jgi:hypothetical protein
MRAAHGVLMALWDLGERDVEIDSLVEDARTLRLLFWRELTEESVSVNSR